MARDNAVFGLDLADSHDRTVAKARFLSNTYMAPK